MNFHDILIYWDAPVQKEEGDLDFSKTDSLKNVYKEEETHHPGSTFLWFTFPAEPGACGDLDNSIAGWNNRNEGQIS